MSLSCGGAGVGCVRCGVERDVMDSLRGDSLRVGV